MFEELDVDLGDGQGVALEGQAWLARSAPACLLAELSATGRAQGFPLQCYSLEVASGLTGGLPTIFTNCLRSQRRHGPASPPYTLLVAGQSWSGPGSRAMVGGESKLLRRGERGYARRREIAISDRRLIARKRHRRRF